MTISLAAIAAQRANAAYVEDEAASKAAFSALGDVWVAMYQNDSHQVVMSTRSDGITYLSISGTRSPISVDVIEDISLVPVSVKGGRVTQGVYEGMGDMWDWATSTAPKGAKFSVCGHSLGGSRTHLTPLFIPAAQIGNLFSFEAPKFCDAAYYATYRKELSGMLCFLNGSDLWAAWPWHDDTWNARPLLNHVWLTGDSGQYKMISGDDWQGDHFADDPLDHLMSRVEKRVIALDETLFKQDSK
jgi:hypothetical protein